MPTGMTLRDAEALRGYLRLMSMSERRLARRAGVGHATVNHLLSGRRTTCSARTAQAIESALECPAGLFFAPTRSPASERVARTVTG
jgi:transcriptional regulator with XRE-family HTH domain